MGYSTSGGPRGRGTFNNTPSTTADLNKLVELNAKFGNYMGPVTETARDAITGDALYDGLTLFNTTRGTLELRTGSAWKVIYGQLAASMKRSATAKSVSDSTWNQNLAENAYWTENFRDAGIAAYSNGWTIPFAGDWQIEWGVSLNVAGAVGITVNASTVSGYADFSAYAAAPAVQGAGLLQASKTLPLASGDVIRLFGASGSGSATWSVVPKLSWFGIRYVGP